MNMAEIAKSLNLKLLSDPKDLTLITPSGGYASDMLSCVMSGAPREGIWITLQAHGNIVAVAALLDLSAVIITENAIPEAATISRANEKGISLFGTVASTYEIAGKLWALGIRAE
jgi:hypothetical protein